MKVISLLCSLLFVGLQANADLKAEDIFGFVFDTIQDQIQKDAHGGSGHGPGFPGGGFGGGGGHHGGGHGPGGGHGGPGPGFPGGGFPPPSGPGGWPGSGHGPGPGPGNPPLPPPPMDNKVILEDNGSTILLGRVFIQDESIDTVNFPGCHMGMNKPVTHLVVRAQENPVMINKITVTFINGESLVLAQDFTLQNGQTTQWIPVGQNRCVRSVRVNGEAFGPGPFSKRSVVSFVGYKQGF